jgi:GNAT superfamily N-acetyltransferase
MSLDWDVAGPEQVPEVVALVERAYRGDASRLGWTTEADLLDGQRTDATEVTALVGDDDCRLLIGRTQGKLVASLLLRRESQGAYVGMVAIEPALQAKGLGRHLLQHAERQAVEVFSSSSLRMLVIEQRVELIEWYQRRGYVLTGASEPFPYGQPRFGLPRRDDLRLLELSRRL